jgi:hypothetical protein
MDLADFALDALENRVAPFFGAIRKHPIFGQPTPLSVSRAVQVVFSTAS